VPKNISLPNDSDDNVNRLKKTISNMEAAEAAMEFAEGTERATIKEKNERRKESIKELEDEISAENKSRISGYQK
jgi:small acid-soluble spore protein (thioredoxin-like protein)